MLSRVAALYHGRMSIDPRDNVRSIIAAVFLPISFISGFFGMNKGGLPGVDREIGTPIVALLMVLTTGSTAYCFKRKRWL